MTPSPSPRALPLAAGLCFVAWLLSAWVSDDAYITFRTVDNALGGFGLTWNPVERVQAFTHPLWLFLLLPLVAITGDVDLTALALGLALGAVTLWVVVRRIAPSTERAILALLLLAGSKAYLDYASSGLEDPLTRLLLVLLALRLMHPADSPRRHAAHLGLLAAAGALCRPDAFVLFFPALVLEARRRRDDLGRFLSGAALGLLPLALWGAFAFVYFGSFLPNTAYAKLGMGVPRGGLLLQSVAYLADSLSRDPLTLVVIAVAAWSVWWRPRPETVALAAGAALYLLFVVWIGGDYMSGRLLGSPLLLAVLCLSRSEVAWPDPARRLAFAGAALLVMVRMASPFIVDNVGPYGVGDERRTHHPYTGLVYALGSDPWPQHSLRSEGEQASGRDEIEVSGAIGLFGYYAGPEVTIVDLYGLSDPLLARLPGIVVSPTPRAGLRNWRPGHAERPLPDGYLETLATGDNRLRDPDLAKLWDAVRIASRGPLFDASRWRTALALQLGRYDHHVEAYVARNPTQFDRFGPSPETVRRFDPPAP